MTCKSLHSVLKFTCGTLHLTRLPNKIYVSILKLYVKVKLDKMILTHSSLSHYSFGSVLLHRYLGRRGVDPTVEDIQKVEESMAGKKNGVGTDEMRDNTAQLHSFNFITDKRDANNFRNEILTTPLIRALT